MVCACSIHDLLLFRSIGCRRIELIENGVEVRRFFNPDKQPDLSRLLYVGGFRSNKGVLRLLGWFRQALTEWPDLHLTLVGDGEQKADCLNFVQSNGLGDRVRFAGHLSDDDLCREYIKAGLFVSASVYEGFGLSVVEAMAAGCLLLLNRIDSFAVFVPEELNGFTVDFGSPEGVSSAYGSLRRLSSAAQKEKSDNSVRIAARFDWDSVQKSFDAVYDLLLDTK
jgi:alpha-1,3-mannosyltransferase